VKYLIFCTVRMHCPSHCWWDVLSAACWWF